MAYGIASFCSGVICEIDSSQGSSHEAELCAAVSGLNIPVNLLLILTSIYLSLHTDTQRTPPQPPETEEE